MISFVYSNMDPVSSNAAAYLIRERGLKEGKNSGRIRLMKIEGSLIGAEIEAHEDSVLYFLSQHRSSSGVSAFTTHPTGNWGDEAKLGGKPRQLSVAAPLHMLGIIKNLAQIKAEPEKTYEATHHGPLLMMPSLFAEFGGSEEVLNDKGMAELLAEAAYKAASDAIDGKIHCSKVVLGIGASHYPSKFNKLAIEKDYAFSHIMPKYMADASMLEQAIERSDPKPEAAVIDWKGINSYAREIIIRQLDQIGIAYERA